jgi:hypothetical protein
MNGMRSSQEELLDRWLDAERNDRGDEADTALLGLFAALPPLMPPAGFADRVLLRAGLEPELAALAAAVSAVSAVSAARRSLFASRWLRAVLVLGLFSVGASALWLPQTLRAVAGAWSVGGAVRMWTASVVAACRWLGSALGLWDLLLTIGHALAAPLETPAVALTMVSCLLVSTIAFHFLRLIIRDRSWTHETL